MFYDASSSSSLLSSAATHELLPSALPQPRLPLPLLLQFVASAAVDQFPFNVPPLCLPPAACRLPAATAAGCMRFFAYFNASLSMQLTGTCHSAAATGDGDAQRCVAMAATLSSLATIT